MVFGNKQKKEEERQADAERRAEQERANQARLEAARSKREQDVAAFINDFVTGVGSSVRKYGSATLYKEIYVPVDAQMNEYGPASGLDLRDMNIHGAAGWSVVAVVPRTYGGFESYKISKTTAYGVSGWGKDEHKVGLGGHIVGVYAILSLTVTPENLEATQDVIKGLARESLPDRLTAPIT